MKISVILPILNEEDCIETTVTTIHNQLKTIVSHYEILAINDGSTDNTQALLDSLKKKYSRLHIIKHKKNRGYGAVLRTGIHHAQYDWIFFTDADMQFDISELKRFIPKTKNYDFIIGYRKNRADSLRRKVISFIYNKIIWILFGLHIRDVDCAFKLMRTSAVENIRFHSNSFFVSVELMFKAFKAHYRIAEIGVTHHPRKNGQSKVTYRQIFSTIKDLKKLYIQSL